MGKSGRGFKWHLSLLAVVVMSSALKGSAQPDSPREYKCKPDVGLWNGKVIADIKLRPPHDDFEAVTLCEKECNTRDGECTGYHYEKDGYCTLWSGDVRFTRGVPSNIIACIFIGYKMPDPPSPEPPLYDYASENGNQLEVITIKLPTNDEAVAKCQENCNNKPGCTGVSRVLAVAGRDSVPLQDDHALLSLGGS
eukprot:XP_001702642.1 predicted protein [Chlamydomonas reinhardtii]